MRRSEYGGRNSAVDPRLGGRRRSRSRSRSPHRDGYRGNYGDPYRDDRRNDSRRGGYRDRSNSPGRGRNTFSPPRYGGRDRTPEDNEIIVVDAALVGLVIGRQGENLKRIEQQTRTKIQFISGPDGTGPRRQCRITGTPQQRLEAKREINRIIEENGGNPPQEQNRPGREQQVKLPSQPPLREGENSIQIMVPDRTVGLIIGRGGETIRDLQERSGCHVNIVGENKSVNGLRPVNLIGTPQAAQQAKDLILEIVESDTRGGPQGKQDFGRQNGGHDMDRGDSHGGKINDKIMVPSEAVGMIIGKGIFRCTVCLLSAHNYQVVKPFVKSKTALLARLMCPKRPEPTLSVKSDL
jgi:far upstream element-binding protein